MGGGLLKMNGLIFWKIYVYVYMCFTRMFACAPCVYSAHGVQKRVLGQHLEVWLATMWLLGIEFES